MVDVRLPLTSYPSFTFPTHATMYTGTWPWRHGICGHKFMVRDEPPEWDYHPWDGLPRALSLQGFCTDSDGEWGRSSTTCGAASTRSARTPAAAAAADSNSSLRVDTLFHRVERTPASLAAAVHAFYHGARQPWDPYGKDQWWHYDSVELRSVKDICSDEDLDQLEVADHGTFAKAELAVRFMPSTVSVTPPNPNLARSVGLAFTHRDGVPAAGWRIDGEPHPDGAPDLLALYAASIDESSHHAGPRAGGCSVSWRGSTTGWHFIQALRTADGHLVEHDLRLRRRPRAPGYPPTRRRPGPVLGQRPAGARGAHADPLRRAETADRTIIDANRLSASSVYSDLLRDQVRAWARP
ncbi:MAG: alkaline phosphatase family protein [Nocardioides sp.]